MLFNQKFGISVGIFFSLSEGFLNHFSWANVSVPVVFSSHPKSGDFLQGPGWDISAKRHFTVLMPVSAESVIPILLFPSCNTG